MSARELLNLSIEELSRREEDLRQEIFQLKMQKATGQITDIARLGRTKRELARVLTVLKGVHGE